MQNIFDSLLANTYQLDLPMPVISVTELNLHVEKGSTYVGAIEIYNSAGGFLIGIVEVVEGKVQLQEDTIKGNRCEIVYTIDATRLSEGYHEDTLIITYNGGEILIPVQILIAGHIDAMTIKKWIPKPVQLAVTFSFDQKSYHPDEVGVLTISNPFNRKVGIKLTNGEGYLNFNESDFEVFDTKTIEFTFKVTKLDRLLGKVPLKTSPKIEFPFSAQIIKGHKTITQNLSTVLTELSKLDAQEKITNQDAFNILLKDLIQHYCSQQLANTKANSLEELLEKLSRAINFDRTNVKLRLFYCFLAIENGNKNLALKEINNLDRFLLYYDKESQDVSDVLMLLLELCKGDGVQDLLNSFKLMSRENWLKILLKNRLLTNRSNSYEDYRNLYKLGEKNTFLYLETVLLLNHLPMVPIQEDHFYKSVLLWALRKGAIGVKWLKKLEASHQILLRYGNVNGFIAQRLYELEPNKSMLMLICSVYISEKRFDSEAYYLYHKAMSEKVSIIDLELAYIQGAYYCNEMLNLDYIKMFFNVDKLETTIKAYFYLNLFLQKDQHKSLYSYHSKKIEGFPLGYFKDLMVPRTYIQKLNYIQYLLHTNQIDQMVALSQGQKLEDISHSLENEVIERFYEEEEEQAIVMAKRAFSKGSYELPILSIMGEHYKGKMNSLIDLYGIIKINGLESTKLEEEILYKGILTRKYPEKVMEVYVSYCKDLTIRAIHEWMLNYISAQIIIEEVIPPVGIIQLLEEAPHLKEDLALSLALLKAYTKSEIKNNRLKDQLINNLMKNGIVFSWYAQLVPEDILGESSRIYHYFEYNSQPDQEVYFYYRIADEEQYQRIRMKHVTLGMYIVSIVIFYNEEIQYYIDEKSKDGKRDIKLCDIYIKRDLLEEAAAESLFDLINTLEISKEMNDELSIERTIESYLAFTKKEIEKVTIL